MKRTLVLVVATAALACGGLAVVALAHTVKHPTTVTIKHKKGGHKPGKPDTFDGKVSSDTPRCVALRKVNVKTVGTTPTLVGTTKTDASGNWALELTSSAQPGDYDAVATRKILRKTARHRHTCARGVSPTVTVK
jgi:hypothetical protein